MKDLLSDTEWGGEETMWTASRLKRVNIVIFSENSGCRYPEFNEEYSRTVCIAYAGASHYNSVHEVPMENVVDEHDAKANLCKRFDSSPEIHMK